MHSISQDYFQPYQNYFWEWEFTSGNHSAMAVVVDGPSIAYLDVIKDLIDDLNGDSLPSIGALFLLLYATRPQAKVSHLDSLRHFFQELRSRKTGIKAGFVTFDSAMKLLHLLRELPEFAKTETNRKIIISSLLKDCIGHLGETSYSQIKKDVYESDFLKQLKKVRKRKNDVPKHVFYQDVRILSVISAQYSSQECVLGLLSKETPLADNKEVELELEHIYRLPDFVNILKGNSTLFKAGGLIKYLWSGMNLPKQDENKGHQPLGGVSDLTNTGDFDRILISEFAYSEDVFLSRLVNHEILFLDRETPPQKQIKTSIYLLDISLTTWGVPKIIELALFLSFVSQKKSNHNNRLVLIGEEAKEEPFSTLNDLINVHNSIDGCLLSTQGIQTFLEAYELDKQTEVVVLTSNESYEMLEFQKEINAYREKIDLVITASRFGEIKVWSYAELEKYIIKDLTIPLKELWEKTENQNHLFNFKHHNKNLQGNIPILFPWIISKDTTFKVNGLYYLIFHNSVWLWKKENRGVQLIYSELRQPENKFWLTIALTNQGNAALYTYDKMNHKIQIYTFNNQNLLEIGLEDTLKPKRLFNNAGQFCIQAYDHSCWTLGKDNRFNKTNDNDIQLENRLEQEKVAFYTTVKQNKECRYNVLTNVDYLEAQFSLEQDGDYRLYLGDKFVLSLSANPNILSKDKYFGSLVDADSIELKSYASLFLKKMHIQKYRIVDVLKQHNISLSIQDINLDEGHLLLVTDKTLKEILEIKLDLENCGAVCYYKIDMFKFIEGSTVSFYKGMIEFISSDASLKPFYISSVINSSLGMASDDHFAGNPYFYNETQEVIETNAFYELYIQPFIARIETYEN